MIAIAVDDEALMLGALVAAIEVSPDITEVAKFSDCEEALEFAKNNLADIAFLDINMRGMGGLALAEKIIAARPNCKIVFCTGYEEYAIPAFKLHASGYLMKPIAAEDVQAEIDNINRIAVSDLHHGRSGTEAASVLRITVGDCRGRDPLPLLPGYPSVFVVGSVPDTAPGDLRSRFPSVTVIGIESGSSPFCRHMAQLRQAVTRIIAVLADVPGAVTDTHHAVQEVIGHLVALSGGMVRHGKEVPLLVIYIGIQKALFPVFPVAEVTALQAVITVINATDICPVPVYGAQEVIPSNFFLSERQKVKS